jgi:hypothetical protein
MFYDKSVSSRQEYFLHSKTLKRTNAREPGFSAIYDDKFSVPYLKIIQNVSRIVKIKANTFEIASNTAWLIINILRERKDSTRNLCRPRIMFSFTRRNKVFFIKRN